MLLLGIALAAAPSSSTDCEALDARVQGDCITPQLRALREAGCVPQLEARGLSVLTTRPPVPPPAPDKATRDALGVPNSLESENFVVRWGSGVTNSQALAVLDAFEAGWKTEVEDMGYPGPWGSDSTKFNVEVAETGGNTPQSYNAAGYFWEDPDGWPMVVLSTGTVGNMSYGKTTAVHELFHAIQDATDSPYGYGQGVPGAWYHEATASWVEVEVYPDNEGYAEFLFGYSFFPHLSLNYFDYADGSGGLAQYHQYGAFIWVRYLAEHVGDWRIIKKSWVQADDEDPLVVLDAQLRQDHDLTLKAAFFDFAARNVAWDYEHGELYAAVHEQYATGYPSDDHRLAASHIVTTDGWVEPPAETLPWRLGTNYIRLFPQDDGPDLHVQFEGEATGAWSSNAAWDVRVVVLREAAEPEYWELLLDERQGNAWIEDSASADEIWLVVNVTTGEDNPGETFAYSYNMEPGEAPEDTGLDLGEAIENLANACACSSGRPLSGWVLMVAGAVLLARRR